MKKNVLKTASLLFLIIIISESYRKYPGTLLSQKFTYGATKYVSTDNYNKGIKYQNDKELKPQDFESVYKLGETFLNDYYLQKSGRTKIDFSKYITNKNLLKFSDKKVLIDKKNLDIVDVFIGLDEAHFIHKDKCFYLNYAIVTKNSYNGGFGETVEILVCKENGKLVITDWYIRFGAGSSYFDEKFRPNANINSPEIWKNQKFVNMIFRRAAIE